MARTVVVCRRDEFSPAHVTCGITVKLSPKPMTANRLRKEQNFVCVMDTLPSGNSVGDNASLWVNSYRHYKPAHPQRVCLACRENRSHRIQRLIRHLATGNRYPNSHCFALGSLCWFGRSCSWRLTITQAWGHFVHPSRGCTDEVSQARRWYL